MNKTILSGRLTAEPTISATTGSREPISIAAYTLAVQRDFKNQNGEYDADFIRCKTFGARADFAEKYLHKGMKIIVEGRLQSGSYDKDGQKHYTTDLIVEKHEFAESKNAQNSQPQAVTYPSSVAVDPNEEQIDVTAQFSSLQDDDIPF